MKIKIERNTSHDDILIIEEPEKESIENKVKHSDSYGKDRTKEFSNYDDNRI